MDQDRVEHSAVYRVQQFATLAGVTVRTLHHYDRLGLLRPARNGSGYRVYNARHLERLEQIVALRFVGVPLGEIADLLGREQRSLPEVLQAQLSLLQHQRRQCDRAIAAIEQAAEALREERPVHSLLPIIVKELRMQDAKEAMNRYYSPEAQAAIEERRQQWNQHDNPAIQQKISDEWQALFRDVRAAASHVDPASAEAQALVARWDELVGRFTGGNPEVAAGLKKAWADRENWPAQQKQQSAAFMDPEVWGFMQRARQARPGGKGGC